ncbi:MAG: type I restriction endonuclease subunit R, partial [Deltaproteobacteria bacterium]|nr:type I restriction endonuclease subunit R [Deltaproteobacteria bacterium]
MFEEDVSQSIQGKGKAMVVASSRPAGLKYFETIKTILKEKNLPYKVLFAFSDFNDSRTNKTIEETVVNELESTHDGKLIEDVFDLQDYRILVVANKFQTGFDQPLLSSMFLDKSIKGVNAVQTVSRLNRKHKDKEQEDILVVDFTNNSQEI